MIVNNLKEVFEKNNDRRSVVLYPFFLFLLADVICIPFPMASKGMKLLGFLSILVLAVVYREFILVKDRKLIVALIMFLIGFIVQCSKGFYWKSIVEDGVRYLFPLIILTYSYLLRGRLEVLMYSLIVFCFANILFQFIGYTEIGFFSDVRFAVMSGWKRASGFLGFFGVFGFLNFCCFLLVYYFSEKGQLQKTLLVLFGVFIFLSLSMKLIFVFLIFLLVLYRNDWKKLVLGTGLGIVTVLFTPGIKESIEVRIKSYVLTNKSARSESYIQAYNLLKEGNWFGTGVGTFGGPASTKYDSPLYDQIEFNWYETTYINTTDTYYPHPVVELGLPMAVLYLGLILYPLVFLRKNRNSKYVAVIFIYFGLFFDSFFSFALNNTTYLVFSLLFVHPVIFKVAND